jgi:hypothetical protein
MRVLLAFAMSAGGILSLHAIADAAPRSRRAQPPFNYAPPSSALREQSICEDRAQNADPAGRYEGYPCWAREIFSRTPR